MIKIKYFIHEDETTILQKLADAESNRVNKQGGLAGHNVKIDIVEEVKLPMSQLIRLMRKTIRP